jgi:CheY-like chemotaxis protein
MTAERVSVMLVEDNPDDVLLVRRAFARLGLVHPLTVLSDGEAAIDYLAGRGDFADRGAHPLPAMILLDLKLPKVSGHELLSWLRGQEIVRRIPVVILTTSDERSDVNRAYDLGANSYLRKPVSFDALIEILTRLNVYWLTSNEPPDLVETKRSS